MSYHGDGDVMAVGAFGDAVSHVEDVGEGDKDRGRDKDPPEHEKLHSINDAYCTARKTQYVR